MWNFQSVVEDELGEEILSDRVHTRLGWVCWKNEDLASGSKYRVAYNHPTTMDEIDYISQFKRSAPIEAVRNFYRSCNGMSVGTVFSVPGVRFSPELNDGLEFFNIPYDFQVLGGILLPPKAPVEGLVIGATSEWDGGGYRTLYDIMDDTGDILGGYFAENESLLYRFRDPREWLATRVGYAVQECQNELFHGA